MQYAEGLPRRDEASPLVTGRSEVTCMFTYNEETVAPRVDAASHYLYN